MRVGLGFPYWGNDPVRERNFGWVRTYVPALVPFSKVIVSEGNKTRGSARNDIVMQLSDMDVVVICDADSFCDSRALDNAIQGAYHDGGLHFPYDQFRCLSDAGTIRLLDGHSDWGQGLHASGPGSLGGIMAIRPGDWAAAGWSPDLEGWGFEDVMFAVQARTFLRPNTWYPGWISCLFHETECKMGSKQYNINIRACKEVEALDKKPEELRNHMRRSPWWS